MDRNTFFLVAAAAGSLLLSACATTEPADADGVAQSRQQMQEMQTERINTDRRRVSVQRDLRNQRDRVQTADAERASELRIDP